MDEIHELVFIVSSTSKNDSTTAELSGQKHVFKSQDQALTKSAHAQERQKSLRNFNIMPYLGNYFFFL